MTLHLISAAEKLGEVEDLIRFLTEYNFASPGRMAALKAIASDLKAQIPAAPVAAVIEIERRLQTVKKRPEGMDRINAQRAVADEIAGRWPVIRQALEFYQSHVEKVFP